MSNGIKIKCIRGILYGLFCATFFSPEIATIIVGYLWLGIIMGAIKLGFWCLWFLTVSAENREEYSPVPFIVWFALWGISSCVVSEFKLPLRWIIYCAPAGWLPTGVFFAVTMKPLSKIVCRVCGANAKLHAEIPYCKKCLANSLNKTLILKREVEERIENAEKLGMWKQIEGARSYFAENLPGPIKWILANLIVGESMLESGKTIEKVGLTPFNPKEFQKFPVDIERTDLNIPGEGLKVLAKILPVKDENKNLERR